MFGTINILILCHFVIRIVNQVFRNDNIKSNSRSRPKQRHTKLIEDKEKVSSILKIMGKRNETPQKIAKILAISDTKKRISDRSKSKPKTIQISNISHLKTFYIHTYTLISIPLSH